MNQKFSFTENSEFDRIWQVRNRTEKLFYRVTIKTNMQHKALSSVAKAIKTITVRFGKKIN